MKDPIRRRTFLKSSAFTLLPFIAPLPAPPAKERTSAEKQPVNFLLEGEIRTVQQYADKLAEICRREAIEPDRYGEGGCVAALESHFEAVTGKEKAIFMPSGTMANQLAAKVLSGQNTKIFVHESSHMYRDEADAAQSLHARRLIPIGKEKPWFSLDDLKAAIGYHHEQEYIPSLTGAVVIEIPTRRSDNTMMPFDEYKKVCTYCRENNIPVHLDGARIYQAAAWSGVPISEYAALADTVYISLYKYLGASAGAILCGKKEVIGQMPLLIKRHGGSQYRNWTNAAMALHEADGYMERLINARKKGEALIAMLNTLPQMKINSWPDATNTYRMELSGIDKKAFQKALAAQGISAGQTIFSLNVSVLHRDNNELFHAFKDAIKGAAL
ncbi:beta-eliminating lyase-related protein [uncultured Chitinophaga sp.]|jgi:Threonine aldolase|uniref:threonine aldolase family protein n=1 Tax=uncultured Chitinophaga sp. TaxID=339340 RepID=UPI00262771D1|nr:beta-eliminating lyase-related protein [uncultured Chitinophaga sp.]